MSIMTRIRIVSVLAGVAFAVSAFAAEPKETVAAAIKSLKEKGSYSWTTASEMAGGQFNTTTKGKAEKDWAVVTTETQNGEVQAVRKGEKGVLKTDDGWKTAEELRASAQGGGGGGGRGMFRGRMLSMPLPIEDAEEMLKGAKDLKAGDNGVFSADLTEEAAKDRASFFGRRRGQNQNQGQNFPEPKDAKGSVKFWVKDGALTKMELKSHSKIEFNNEEREIDRTTTTEFSNVGSTKVEPNADAKKKLE